MITTRQQLYGGTALAVLVIVGGLYAGGVFDGVGPQPTSGP